MDKVWVASWDVRNSGTGREVFSTKEKAVEAVMDWTEWLRGPDAGIAGMLEADYRAGLEDSLFLEFRECWYNIEECEVQ